MHPWLWWHCCSRWIQRYHIAFANSSTVYTGGVAEAATISHPSIIATHWNCWNWRLTHSLNQRRSEFGCSGILLSSTYLKSPKLSARKSEFKDFLFLNFCFLFWFAASPSSDCSLSMVRWGYCELRMHTRVMAPIMPAMASSSRLSQRHLASSGTLRILCALLLICFVEV